MLPPEQANDGFDDSTDTAAIIAEALKEKFGPGAPAVAEVQRETATEETVAKWDEIVALLTEGKGHPG